MATSANKNTIAKLATLESAILKKGNKMSSEDASTFHKSLILIYKEFSKSFETESGYYEFNYSEGMEPSCNIADFVQKKVHYLEKILLRFFTPVFTISLTTRDEKVTDQNASTNSNLPSLLRKQKFYVKLIDSLEPADDMNSKEAEVQSEQLSRFEEKFNVNQSEIITLIEDASFDDQVEIAQKVQQKVRKIQAKLKEISAIKTLPSMPPASSLVNEHFNKTERPRVIVDFLDSQIKKQKSLIEQIELIESKNDLGATEAETLHGHLLQLHDTFVKNQSKIETYVSGSALDEQLRISGEILQKVMVLQTKLKEMFAPVKSLSEDVSSDGVQSKFSDSIVYLNWLYQRLADLEKEITSIVRCGGVCQRILIDDLYKWFLSYQKKIEELVGESAYDLRKLKEISGKVEPLTESYKRSCEYLKNNPSHQHCRRCV